MNPAGTFAISGVRCIGSRAPHNAFCDIVERDGTMWLVYREGAAHVSPDGTVRLLSSCDGREWIETAHIVVAGEDLRDPKLSVAPDGRLMLLAAAVIRNGAGRMRQLRNLVWFSEDGRVWGGPREVAERGIWLWRITWHRGEAYGIGYACNVPRGESRYVRLYRSVNGVDYEILVDRLVEGGYPNEHALVFLPDDRVLCLLRCDDERKTALLGSSAPPYTQWEWRPLGRRVGGPHLLLLPDGRIAAGVRLYDGAVRTSLCGLDPTGPELVEWLTLPSGGDTSYSGMVWRDGGLWVAWYSSHEERSSVYLARLLPGG